MATIPVDPSVGINAETGGTITGWDHVLQSLQDIFTTHFGARVMREFYGSFVPVMLGRANINAPEGTLFMTAVATAIMQWEPRLHVTAIRLTDASRGGDLAVAIEGEYRPRATYGDLSAQGGGRRLIVSRATGASWNITEG
jgi:uncharacterized protein